MKRTGWMIGGALLLLPAFAFAAEHGIEMKIKGMVCSFCVTGLKKVLERQDAVESTTINLAKHQVRVFLKPGKQVSEKEMDEWVKEAGFKMDTFEVKF